MNRIEWMDSNSNREHWMNEMSETTKWMKWMRQMMMNGQYNQLVEYLQCDGHTGHSNRTQQMEAEEEHATQWNTLNEWCDEWKRRNNCTANGSSEENTHTMHTTNETNDHSNHNTQHTKWTGLSHTSHTTHTNTNLQNYSCYYWSSRAKTTVTWTSSSSELTRLLC